MGSEENHEKTNKLGEEEGKAPLIRSHKNMAPRAGLMQQDQPKQNMTRDVSGLLTGKQTN